MAGSINQPKVFISYSWSSPKHEQWVRNLAERLFGHGIQVVLDKWDLKEGQDKHIFMEQMVSDASIAKVLVICDAVYQSKANIRKGGVGTESQLISKEVYENTVQEKFIPIVVEYDKDGKPCLPLFMSSRIYIDLSTDDEKFEENYERLVRNLYNKPELKKPVLGTPPPYITENDPIYLRTSHKVQEIRNALTNSRPIAKALISDYYELFLESLEEHRLSGGNAHEFDDQVLKSIEQMRPMRDDFIDFVFTIFKYQEEVNLDDLKEFFEKLFLFHFPSSKVTTYTDFDCDNLKFFSYELMLYFIAILLKLKKFQEVAFFIDAQYYYQKNYSPELLYGPIELFNPTIRSIELFRNSRLQLQRISITADLIKERANNKEVSFDEVKKADLMIYYLRSLASHRAWFPRTSIYEPFGGTPIDIFQRLVSSKHFDKVKVLFGVNTKDELKAKMATYVQDFNSGKKGQFDSFSYNVQPLDTVIKIETVATKP